MRLTKSQAALFNARELRLLTAKGPREVSDLATAIRQVRDLRDKQRDLQQRQDQRLARSGTGRVGAMGIANERTAAKERLLDEALDEMQQQLRRIDEESSLACRELLDDEDGNADAYVPGRRANPKKGAKRATKKTPNAQVNRGTKKSPSATRRAGSAAKKATSTRTAKRASSAAKKAAVTKRAGGAARKAAAKRAAAKAPATKRSSKSRVAVPKRLGGDAAARPTLASRTSRGTRAR